MKSAPPCTPESVREAQYACWRERREVERLTGVRIDADGRFTITAQLPVAGEQIDHLGHSRTERIGLVLGSALGRLRD